VSAIPDFTDAERWVVETALKERYGKPVEVQVADAELRLSPDDRELTPCPTLFWEERGAGFVISKLGDDRFRTQFFYSKRDHYGTGREEYDDLLDCVTSVLRLQADHERDRDAAGGAGKE